MRSIGLGFGTRVAATIAVVFGLVFGGALAGCGDDNGGPGGSGPDASLSDAAPAADSGADSAAANAADAAHAPLDAGPDAPSTPAATPTFTPASGAFATAESVTIATTTPNATIFYTLDGTVPTEQSATYTTPIAIAQTTTISAIAKAPNTLASAVATATYTINIPPGTVAPVAFNPVAGTMNNDFVLSLSTMTAGATICYTTDGSLPGCTAGTCAAGSLTYDATQQVAVSGGTTAMATSSESVNAVACLAGSTNSTVTAQIYTLQVAAPVLQTPDAGTLAYRAQPYAPTASSPTTGAVAWTSRDAANPPTCGAGTQMALPGPVTISPALGTQTIAMIGCKTGYLPSAVTSTSYAIQLNPPAFVPDGGAALNANTAVVLNDSANAHATTNDWVCATTDNTTPACTSTGCANDAGAFASLQDQAAIATLHATGTTIQAIACSSASPNFVPSTVTDTAYTFKLDPIRFTPPSGTPIPTAPGSLSVTFSQNNPGGDEPYDFLCYTTNGTTTPDCTCTSTGQTKSNGTSSPSIILTGNSAVTLQAVGCLNAGNPDKYQPSAVATGAYPPAGHVSAPTILPAATTQNNDTQIQFVNTDMTATVDVCYTTNGTAPTCGGTCTAATMPGATVNGPIVTATATTVRALGCDVSLAKSPSPEASPVPVYTLQVGDPSITPNGGAVNLGGSITFSTATKNAVFHYLTNGNTPDCATAPTITATGADPGPYTAVYHFTGTETGGAVKVIACKANYTQSANVGATFTPTLATPTFKYGTGTFDDTLVEQVRVSPGIAGTWVCLGAGATCGGTANSCNGVNSTSIPTTTTGGVSTASVGTVTNSGVTLNAIACAEPNAAVVSSASASATYTLQTSALRFNPAPGTQTGPKNISVSLQPAITLPQGDGNAATGVSSNTEICISTTQSPPPQPAPCAGFVSSAWTCATGGGTSGLGAGVSPIIAFSDVGTNTTFSAFTCRDGFVYQTSTAAYTFAAYSHTIAMTGAVADFNAAAEQIPTSDAGSFAYVSWDMNNVYVGFDKGVGYASSDYVHFYIGGASGGTQTTDTAKLLSPQTLPTGTHALFHVWWKVDNTDTGVDLFGTMWAATAVVPTVRFNQGSTFVEFALPRSPLGTTTDIHLVGGLWSGAASFGSWPLGQGTPTTDVAWNNFQDEQMGAAYLPNDANRLNQP